MEPQGELRNRPYFCPKHLVYMAAASYRGDIILKLEQQVEEAPSDTLREDSEALLKLAQVSVIFANYMPMFASPDESEREYALNIAQCVGEKLICDV